MILIIAFQVLKSILPAHHLVATIDFKCSSVVFAMVGKGVTFVKSLFTTKLQVICKSFRTYHGTCERDLVVS